MAEKNNNNKENNDPAYKYIKPTFKGKDPAYKFIKKESKNDDPAFRYISNTNNGFVNKFKRNFKSNLKKQDQDFLDKENSPDNVDPAFKYIKQSDKAYVHIKKIKENNNQNIEAQQRLLGSIKNIGKAINGKENQFKKTWKSKLNDDEKDFLNSNPGSNFENLESFKRRFNASNLKEIKKQNIPKKTESKTIKPVVKVKSKVTKKNKLELNENKENNKTIIICFYCSSPMSEEDLFCGECGKPKKLTNKVLEKNKDLKVEKVSSIKKNNLNELPIESLEYLKSLFEDELIAQSEYDNLRKSILNLSIDSDIKNKINDNVQKIRLISREKLSELKNLFDKKLIDEDEYKLLRENLLFKK